MSGQMSGYSLSIHTKITPHLPYRCLWKHFEKFRMSSSSVTLWVWTKTWKPIISWLPDYCVCNHYRKIYVLGS